MTSPTPSPGPRRPSRSPQPLHERAAADLTFIRDTMARAGSFTAVPGWGGVAMGLTAVVAGWLASRRPEPMEWLAIWLAEAVIAVGVGGIFLVRKAAATGAQVTSRAARLFAAGFAPPMAAGVVLTPVLVRADQFALLPGLWLLLYGAAVTAAGAFSVPVVPVMGAVFMLLGAVALVVAPAGGDLFLVLGFGVAHIVAGLIIARRYGG